LTKVRREWAALTAGPVSFSWWIVKACVRAAVGVALFGLLLVLHHTPPALQSVVDGTTSPLALLPWALTTPSILFILAIAAVVSFLLPFLPDRDPYNNQY
jgi:hypothetical protein